MGCGVGRAVVSFRVLGTGGGCVVEKKEDVKLNSVRKLFARKGSEPVQRLSYLSQNWSPLGTCPNARGEQAAGSASIRSRRGVRRG